ncbi:MAG TPA: hypothetical protein VFZ01_02910 [Geminicoccaceae bacterium]
MGAVLALASSWRSLSGEAVARLLTWRLARLGLVLAGAAVLAEIGLQLHDIGGLSRAMQQDALPAAIAQQKRAIWTEHLRSAADIVVFADEAERGNALAKAEQLADNLIRNVSPEKRQAVEHGLAALMLAAQASRRAAQLDREIKLKLAEANEVIGDMRANLASIVEDSSGTLARLLRDAVERTFPNRPLRGDLEEVLALNTTSQDLLASLDRGRILLADARSMEQEEEVQRAAARFEAIGHQLRARVETLRGNSDYEYLPDMIERFLALGPVFRHRQAALLAEAQALDWSGEAKRRLGVLRENLSADAASRAEAHLASIIAAARRAAFAFALLSLLALLGAGAALARARRGPLDDGLAQLPADPSPPGAASRTDLEKHAMTLRQMHVGLENLEHWRDHLPSRLRSTLRHLLARHADHDGLDPLPTTCAPEPVGERRISEAHRFPPLPEDVEERLAKLFDLVWSFTRDLIALGHAATEQLVAPGDTEAGPDAAMTPATRIDMIALAVDEAVALIGSSLDILNRRTRLQPPDPEASLGAVIDAIDRLSRELTEIRGRMLQPLPAPARAAA